MLSGSFYRAFNCIFGKVGRVAYENVVIELMKTKCYTACILGVRLYGLEACPINACKSHLAGFVLNSTLRKIFVIKSYDVANAWTRFFNCSVSDAICQ